MSTTTSTGYRDLVAQLRERREAAALGGPETSRRRHVARGKLLARDRIDAVLDRGSPFLEVAPLAADDLYDGRAVMGSATARGVYVPAMSDQTAE